MDSLGPRDSLEMPAHPVNPVAQVSPDRREKMGSVDTDCQVDLDLRDNVDRPDSLEDVETMVVPEPLDPWDRLARTETLVILEPMDIPEDLVDLDFPETTPPTVPALPEAVPTSLLLLAVVSKK